MTTLNILSKYLLVMELRFDVMLYCNMGNKDYIKGLIKCSHGLQVPHPWCTGPNVKGQQNITGFIEFFYQYSWMISVHMLIIIVVERYFQIGLNYLIPLKKVNLCKLLYSAYTQPFPAFTFMD